MAISSVSFFKTPQAGDDVFWLNEEDRSITYFDVMSNDLGGKAKILWSLDDGGSLTDLLAQDGARVESMSADTSAMGAKIWITSTGQVGYDGATLTSDFQATLQSLAIGEAATDTFRYTIRLANGTLSWATATVVYAGVNDAPVISVRDGDKAADDLAETNSALSTAGRLTVRDPDTSDVVDTVISGVTAVGDTGGLTDEQLLAMLSLTGSQDLAANALDLNNLGWAFDSAPTAFDFLAADETLKLTYTLTSSDGHGGSDTQTVTITITGTNDAAVITGATTGAVTEDTVPGSATGNLDSTDVDGTADSFTAVSVPAASALGYGTYVVDATGHWTYSIDNSDPMVDALAVGETLFDSFTVTAADGTPQTVTITITGTNDAPIIGIGDTSGGVSDVDGSTSTSGSLAFGDVDLTDAHSVSSAANADGYVGTFGANLANASTGDGAGSIGWSFSVDRAAIDHLGVGDSLIQSYTITVDDGEGGTDTETVTITITGTNDAPVIAVGEGDSDAETLAETDSGLAVSGTLSVTDVDTSDAIDSEVTGVLVSGSAGSLTDAQLLAMLTLGNDNDLAANTGNSNNLGWAFASGSEAFDYLAPGQSLVLSYTVTSTDNHGLTDTQMVTITITGTNDAPVASNLNTAESYTEDTPLDLADIVVTDPDSDVTVTLTLSNATAGALTTATSGGVTSTFNASTGVWTASGSAVDVNALLASVMFTPVANFNGDLTIATSVSDGLAPAITGSKLLTGIAVNDAPTADDVSLGSYHEDGLRLITPAELLAGASDVDGDPLTITALTIASGGGILYPNADGSWYYRPVENSSGPVSFTYTVSDGNLSASGTANLEILPSNDPPFLDLNPDSGTNSVTLAYTSGAGTVLIAPGATVTDVDSPDFGGGFLTVRFAQGGSTGDTLAIRNQGVGAGQIGVSGGNVTYGGVVIGTFTGGTAGTQLSISFNANATQVAVSALLDNITFVTSDTGTVYKEVHFVVGDGDGTANFGYDQNSSVAFINVAAADVMKPSDIKFALASTVSTFTTSLTAGGTLGSFTAVDGDSTSWTFTLGGANASLFALSPTSGGSVDLLVGGSSLGGNTAVNYSFTVTATDPGGNTYVETYTLSVGSSNGGTGDLATAFTITAGTDIDFGINGPDAINGGDGDDALAGGNQADNLFGGLGNDQLLGGAQNDTFIFNTALNAATNVDVILDFNAQNADRIHLENSGSGLFNSLTTLGTLAAANFVANVGGNALDANDHILYDTATGNLYYDADGNGAGAKVLFAQLTVTNGTVDASDFIVI